MGKVDNPRLPVEMEQSHGSVSRIFHCRRCWVKSLTPKCAVVLLLALASFLSAVFCVLPVRYPRPSFDAKDSVKLAATIQASFRLQRPVPDVVPYLTRLEYDINEEIGVPALKVAVLSMNPAGLSNMTNVVFGFLPDSFDDSIYPVSISVLKSSLIDLFLLQYNLTLTSSIFGVTSSFEILKFPGGITIIPEPSVIVLQIPETLFTFTLNSSIYEIKQKLPELKEQLRFGLHLLPNEVVFMQVTNKNGSTKDPPVILAVSVVSNIGTLQSERLKHLAQIITKSPAENLGLNHTVFGKVKGISLSSFLKHSLHAPAPTSPSPSPSPSPLFSQIPSSPPPSHIRFIFPSLSPHTYSQPPLASSRPHIPPSFPPSAPLGSRDREESGKKSLVSPPSTTPSSSCIICIQILWFFTPLLVFLCLRAS